MQGVEKELSSRNIGKLGKYEKDCEGFEKNYQNFFSTSTPYF